MAMRSISRNWIENARTFLDLILVVGSACISILESNTYILPIAFIIKYGLVNKI
jgi:hypothetical protein